MYYEENGKESFLSMRETQCICLLAKGFTAKEMARHLVLSPRTIETYLNQIKFKLSCHNRTSILKKLTQYKWNKIILLHDLT